MTKIPENLGPSFFLGKNDKGIISFGSGQPDLPPPKNVVDTKIRSDLRYGFIQGEETLRELLSKEYVGSNANSFVITNGASEALDLVFRAMDNGKVILGQPYYYSYIHILKMAGMTPVFTQLIDGKIDIDDFRKKVKGCKAILINSPSNPTGRVEDIKTLKEIEKIAKELNIYIISDEVYKDLIYERENYFLKGEKVITVNSFSKTYAMCGARIGYLWSRDQDFVNKIIEMKTHTSMNTSLVSQDMALQAIKTPKSYASAQLKIWKRRRDLIYNGLRDLDFDLWSPEGAFYVLPKVKNPKKFVWDLFTKYKVITYMGAWFGAPDRVRFSYALEESKIEEGLSRIKKYLSI